MGKRILKIASLLVLAAALLVGGFLLYITLSDYKPKEVTELSISNQTGAILEQGKPFTVTTFNIGYAGLDSDQDFFMDGGTHSRASSKKQTEANLASIASFMNSSLSSFYLLQEVDVQSSRSYKIDQTEFFSKALKDYSSSFAYNYKVPWVPVPLFEPMGKVHSGLLTLSSFQSTSSDRYDLPGKESWPVQQLDLDRAFIANRFPVQNGKELILVNLHLSAFDKEGKIRKQQLDYLSAYLKKETGKGHYIIVGGDWNHALPGTDSQSFETTQDWPKWLQKFPGDFQFEGFKWMVDNLVPTVRTLDIPYTEGVNFRAVIDGFLVSSNIAMNRLQGTDLKFAFSDHNPVTAEFVLQ